MEASIPKPAPKLNWPYPKPVQDKKDDDAPKNTGTTVADTAIVYLPIILDALS